MKVPVDHFGVAGSALIRALLDQSSNKRARKVAFNNLVRLAKACGALGKASEVLAVALSVEPDGSQWIRFADIGSLPLSGKGGPNE